MSNRPSEPQLIAEELDEVIPAVRRKFAENGTDAEESRLLDALTRISNRQIHSAEGIDLALSWIRIGPNERNLRRLREVYPAALPPESAA